MLCVFRIPSPLSIHLIIYFPSFHSPKHLALSTLLLPPAGWPLSAIGQQFHAIFSAISPTWQVHVPIILNAQVKCLLFEAILIPSCSINLLYLLTSIVYISFFKFMVLFLLCRYKYYFSSTVLQSLEGRISIPIPGIAIE